MNIPDLSVELLESLPHWVHFIAQDADGQWWGYEAEPNQSHNGWYENEVGRIYKLSKTTANPEWQLALYVLSPTQK